MSYAVMPLSDYKAACDKVRGKVGEQTVLFEETDFGFLRSEVFTVPKNSVYIFSYEFSDPSKFSDLYYNFPEWEGETSPGNFEPIDSNSAKTTLDTGAQYRIFITDSLGLTPKDILKATLSIDEEVVVDFVPPLKIKSGELADKVDEVYEAGRKDEQTKFWNLFQNNGTRTWYEHAFFGVWRDEMFNPIYPIIAKNATNMFARNNMTKINAPITITGNLSDTVFYACPTRIISDLTVDETTTFKNWFWSAASLAHLTIRGVIANSIDLSYSPLTVDSMKSVISCLKNYTGTNYELTYKVTFTEACWTALEASGTSPSGGTWKDYVIYTLGWQV